MKRDLHQIFKKISQKEPRPELAGLILAKISELRRRQIKRKLFFSYFSLAGSFGAFFWAIISYGQTFLHSDFWIILQLLLTDATDVMRNWNDFLLSLMETFPVFSTVVMLLPIMAIMFSLSVYFKLSYKNNYNLRLT